MFPISQCFLLESLVIIYFFNLILFPYQIYFRYTGDYLQYRKAVLRLLRDKILPTSCRDENKSSKEKIISQVAANVLFALTSEYI